MKIEFENGWKRYGRLGLGFETQINNQSPCKLWISILGLEIWFWENKEGTKR